MKVTGFATVNALSPWPYKKIRGRISDGGQIDVTD